MTENEIFNTLKETIEEVSDYDPAMISLDTDIASLDLASLDYVSIQVAIKRKFNVEIDLEELPKMNFVTLQDFVKYIGALPMQAIAS